MAAMRRSAGILRIALGVVSLAQGVSISVAAAFEIDKQCQVFKKPRAQIACTCALQTGGWMATNFEGKPTFKIARPRTPNIRSFRNPAYDKCATDNGVDF